MCFFFALAIRNTIYTSQMSFKVVQTTETNGAKKLSVIPHLWENNGQMQWPLNTRQISQTKFNALSADANSVAPPEWGHYNCTVKHVNLSYTSAMAKMKEMSDQSDTQASDSDTMPPPISVQMRNATRPTISIANFREMVNNYLQCAFLPFFFNVCITLPI